jgi:hypothetical protein
MVVQERRGSATILCSMSYQTVDEETKLTKLANFYPDYIIQI